MMHRMNVSWLSTIATFGGGLLKTKRRRRTSRGSETRSSRFELLEQRLALATSHQVLETGPSDGRIDLVYVGDGFVEDSLNYTDTLGYYADKVSDAVNGVSGEVVDGFFEVSPFDKYKSYFNVHRIDEASTEAGIDRPYDPNPVFVITPFDGSANYNDTNFLSATTTDAYEVAADLVDVDYMNLLLNGAGRARAIQQGSVNINGNIVTFGAANLSINDSFLTQLHEMGHILSYHNGESLTDEYFPDNDAIYSGGEPNVINLTAIDNEQEMIDLQAKWFRWLDVEGIGLWPGGGGDRGHEFGVFRPSESSMMRDGTSTFSVVDKEALILGMYRHEDINPIDTATPEGDYHFNTIFEVAPMQPIGHSLSIKWYVDGNEAQWAEGETTFDTSMIDYPDESHTIRAVVVDNTDMVRDESAREEYMTQTLEWTTSDILNVTTEEDQNNTNPSELSLREALALAANSSLYPGTDRIVFAPWVNNIVTSSQLVIGSSVEIVGHGAESLTIDADGASRVFYISSGVTATLSGMTITGGFLAGTNQGAGLYVAGNLTLDTSIVSWNTSEDYGGGIYNYGGTLRIVDSTIANNSSAYAGGIGSRSNAANSVIIENSALINNNAVNYSGLHLSGFSGGGTAHVSNTTFSGNEADYHAGAIQLSSTAPHLTVVNSTITDNHALDTTGQGGGIRTASSGQVTLLNTIVAGNTAGSSTKNIQGTVDVGASWNNLIGVGGTGGLSHGSQGNKVGISDPGLTLLGEYGGKTKSHKLLASSPAIDSGDDEFAKDVANLALSVDQRGQSRYYDNPSIGSSGTTVDIGAVEFSLPKILNVIISSSASSHSPYEFDSEVGTEQQLRTVPVGKADQISIKFNEGVDVSADDLEVISLNPITYFQLVPPLFSVTAPDIINGYTGTWKYGQELPPGQLLLRLSDSITNAAGNSLDGDWTNPTYFDLATFDTPGPSQVTSVFPSGDYAEGGDFEFVFTVLPGDADRDNDVAFNDYQIYTINAPNTPGSQQWSNADFNGDLDVSFTDYQVLTMNYNYSSLALLTIHGDYNNDFAVNGVDAGLFEGFYLEQEDEADFDRNNIVNQLDRDAFYEWLGLEIDLEVTV